ncbi:hypothetical protein SAY86_007114 [Trapa natans]|uniref:Protein CHLOROPLAST IMPORT APPARATUS 2 n=1 Tax=Trapa natans TaxID=22666 RepID=A0AAN7LKT1_TRANT|nr:hypothetical protein SAY86_007114 [Trapa natans]
MPPCLRGCGLQLGVMKSYSTSMTRTSNNSSSSTLSESSNSPIFICTRKPRTKRKRLNQKYNEAAALLSIAYPDIFSSENLISSLKFSSTDVHSSFFDESSELLLPLRAIDKSEFLLQQDLPAVQASGYGRPSFQTEPKPCQSPGEVEIQSNPMEFSSGDYQEELDAGSILDEEMEGIIDAIMEGHTSAANPDAAVDEPYSIGIAAAGFGWKIGSGFEFGRSMNVNNALRNVRGVKNRWDSSFLTVDMIEISPKLRKSALIDSSEKKKRRKKKNAEKSKEEPKHCSNEVSPPGTAKLELLLKLDYDGILRAWSGQGSPFSGEGTDSDEQGMDATVRTLQKTQGKTTLSCRKISNVECSSGEAGADRSLPGSRRSERGECAALQGEATNKTLLKEDQVRGAKGERRSAAQNEGKVCETVELKLQREEVNLLED